MTIRESIIYYQNKKGIKNKVICEACSIGETPYSLFINNKRNLPYDQLQRIMDFLSLEIAERLLS